MQKLKVTNETIQEYAHACHKVLTELLALNMDLTNEEIIESFDGMSKELNSLANEAFDKMREDPEFQQEAEAFLNAIKTAPSSEDSEAASV